MDRMNWRTSSYSTGHGECVEVATAEAVLIRDTTDRGGNTLRVAAGAWTQFLNTLH
jgi:hypothetical protein